MMHHMLRQCRPGGSGIARALLALCCAAIFSGKLQAAPPAQNYGTTSGRIAPQFAVADFDGDSRADSATVQVGTREGSASHYSIRFRLSSGWSSQNIDLTAPTGGLDISSRDVNGDDFLDVIVTTAWTNQPVAVLLNDGQGNFTESDPSVFPGAFATSENSWNFRTDPIPDASAALFSRYHSGDYEEDGRIFFPPNHTRLPIAFSSQFVAFSSVVSFLGRAPPFFSLSL
jgi:hypothetical protein